jgi:hypothetical protein
MSGVPASLQSLAAPAAADPPSLQTLLDNLLPLEIGLELFELTGPASLPSRNALISNTLGFGLATRGFQTGELPVPLVPGVLYPPVASPVAAAPALSAGLGQAGSVGALSVRACSSTSHFVRTRPGKATNLASVFSRPKLYRRLCDASSDLLP